MKRFLFLIIFILTLTVKLYSDDIFCIKHFKTGNIFINNNYQNGIDLADSGDTFLIGTYNNNIFLECYNPSIVYFISENPIYHKVRKIINNKEINAGFYTENNNLKFESINFYDLNFNITNTAFTLYKK